MDSALRKKALIIALRNNLEHNPTVVYKPIFIGETISTIESIPAWECDVLDLDFSNHSLTEIIARISEGFDCILLWSDVHHSPLARQIGRLSKKISPNCKVFVFGRATTFVPQYFERAPFDAVHVYGDREIAIKSYLATISDQNAKVVGISMPERGTEKYIRTAASHLGPSDWPLPNLKRLPINDYKEYTRKIYGEQYSNRISVTAAKGCTWNCSYCGATQEEGAVDRRRTPSVIFDWIENEDINSLDCFLHLYAPDLFYDEKWIYAFSDNYSKSKASFSWRGVTTTKTILNRHLVLTAGKNGCRELAIGIEHIDIKKLTSLKSTIDEIRIAAANCENAGISLKGLVMLGFPGQTEQDINFIEQLSHEAKVSIRFTGYTPLQSLRRLSVDQLDGIGLEDYDRRTFFYEEKATMSSEFFYNRLIKDGGYIYPELKKDRSTERIHA